MKVKDILDRVTTLYNDIEYVRVPVSMYLKFLDDAIEQLILSRPDAHAKVTTVQLVQGTQQEIPADGYVLIDVYQNKKQDEIVPTVFSNYRPVMQVDRKDLDYFSNWQGGKVLNYDYINEYAFDQNTPRIFWVNPFVGTEPVHLELSYSYGVEKFGDIAYVDVNDVLNMDIPLDARYRNPLVSYMLYLLYSTDSTSVVDREVAAKYEGSFYNQIGVDFEAVTTVVPRTENAEAAAAIRQASGAQV